MKLTIRRSLTSILLLDTVPGQASPDIPILISSHHPNVTPDLPDFALVLGNWPNPNVINFSGAEPLSPGIKIVKGSDLSLDPFGVSVVTHGIGASVSANYNNGTDFSAMIFSPYPDLNSGVFGNGINLLDTIRYKTGLATDSDLAIADTYINQTPNGNLPAVISLASRGGSKLFPYFQSTNLFPNRGKNIDSVTLLDSICNPTVPIPTPAIATLGALSTRVTYAGADCFYTELNVNDNLLNVGFSATTDYYLVIPVSVGGSAASGGPSNNFNGVGAWNTGLSAPYQGAAAVYVIPFAYLRNNITFNSNSLLPVNAVAPLACAQAIDPAGVATTAQAGFAHRVVASLGSITPNVLLDGSSASQPTPDFS